jgi:hypothetical protein
MMARIKEKGMDLLGDALIHWRGLGADDDYRQTEITRNFASLGGNGKARCRVK